MVEKQKKKTIPEATVVAATKEEEPDEEEEEELELLQVDVGDVVKVKQVLEETTACTILEQVDEYYHWDNIKLSIMALACAFAVIAQFSPLPFPESRPVLGVCCCLYFLLTGLLQLMTAFVDKDCFLLTKPLATSANKLFQQHGLRVRSELPRFSEWYTVILEFQGLPNSPCVTQTWSVGKFFDVEGMFDEEGLVDEIDELMKRLETGKYDKKDDKKKKV